MKLLLIHPQNPANELTWSRTPYFLIKEFNLRNVGVVPFATGPNHKLSRIFFRLIQFITRLDYQYSVSFRIFSAIKLKLAIHKHKPDVVLHLGTTSAITYLKTKTPNFLYADNTWHLITTYSKEFINPPLSQNKIIRIEKIQSKDYRKFTKIFTQTSFSKNDIVNHYKIQTNKVCVIGNGVGNVEPYFGAKDYHNMQILFVARQSFTQKGGDLMLAASRIVQKKIPNLKIIIEGGAKIKSPYDDIKNIEVRGLSDKSELQNLYKTSTLLVMPAIFEPFGLVYIEAMANKTPIVGLKRGALPDITLDGKYGFLAEDPSPEAIADQIIKALSDFSKLENIAIQGQKFILNNFTWGNVVDKFLANILENKR